MKSSLKRNRTSIFFFLFMTAFFSGTNARAEGENFLTDRCPLELEKRTISRTSDFIIVYGKNLTRNLHKKADKMSLLALIDDKVKAVPFQIDEITQEGKLVLPERPASEKKSDETALKDDDDGLLDENDELVFMIWDTGARLDKDPQG